jgi:hypothetical protein
MLTDGGLALSERNAVGARGSTKVLAASSLGSCLVFVTGSVVTAALAAIDRDMRLSPLDLQLVINAELLPLAGMLCRRFGRRLPLFAGGAVVASGCAMALHIGSNAIYWADIFPPILLLALSMSLAIAPLTTLVLTSVLATLAVFIIEPGPHVDFIPRD